MHHHLTAFLAATLAIAGLVLGSRGAAQAAEPSIKLYARWARSGLEHRGSQPSEGEDPEYFSKLTFFTTSDTHLGWDPKTHKVCNSSYSSYDLNRAVVEELNHLPGSVEWPPSMGGGRVEEPAGVTLSGDIVDRGPEAVDYTQWLNFTQLFGLTGAEGLLRYPVFEGYGNHDGGNLTSGKKYPNYVR